MPATYLISLLAQFGPTIAAELNKIWHNGGELKKEEVDALLVRVAKAGESYFSAPRSPLET